MKKCISTCLLLAMLVAGAHPVLAFHFCGGELYAFGIAGSGVEESCCLAGEQENAAPDKTVISQMHNSCCDIQKISISTDDYQHRLPQTGISGQPFLIYHAHLAPESLSNLMLPEIPYLTNHAFPPGGLVIQHIDILTCICIFRI